MMFYTYAIFGLCLHLNVDGNTFANIFALHLVCQKMMNGYGFYPCCLMKIAILALLPKAREKGFEH